jgi:hypothetical protein
MALNYYRYGVFMFDEMLASADFGEVVTAYGKEWQKIRQMNSTYGKDENDNVTLLGTYYLAIEKGTQLPSPVSIIFVTKD